MAILYKSKTGFTVIELLVVIAIIAVLSAIVVTQVFQYETRSKEVAIKANMDTFVKAATVY